MNDKNNLDKLREEINALDNIIAPSLARRMGLSLDVARAKTASGRAVYDPSREAAVLDRVEALVRKTNPEVSGYVRSLYGSIMHVSKERQYDFFASQAGADDEPCVGFGSFPKSGSVACQGIDGAYSSIAARNIFVTPSIGFYPTWAGVIAAVREGDCEFGILPIENSTAGSVHAVYDLLNDSGLFIVRSHKLRVEHALLAKKGSSLSDIREIISHEQALQQCEKFLAALQKGNPGLKITSCSNTAVAAKIAADSDGRIAAIASPECAGIYSLSVLEENIVSAEHNFTRFICIAGQPRIYDGAAHSSFMLSLRNEPGTLFNVVSLFAGLGINISKLESRPIAGSDFEFLFYFDIEAVPGSEGFRAVLRRLPDLTTRLVYLGSY